MNRTYIMMANSYMYTNDYNSIQDNIGCCKQYTRDHYKVSDTSFVGIELANGQDDILLFLDCGMVLCFQSTSRGHFRVKEMIYFDVNVELRDRKIEEFTQAYRTLIKYNSL